MPAPGDFIAKFSEKLAITVIPLLHEIWDRCEKETRDKIAADLVQGITSGRMMGAVMPPASAAPQAGLGLPDPIPKGTPTPSASMSPQKRGAQNRAPKGRIKGTVAEVLAKVPDAGITRSELRDEASRLLGEPIKEGSLKQALRLLREGGDIENRDLRWYPIKKGSSEEQI
jgi:hypothetical protein